MSRALPLRMVPLLFYLSVSAAGQLPVPLGPPKTIHAEVLSETYLGMVGCATCSGIRMQLALYREEAHPAAYHLRETFYGETDGERVVETNGTWTEPRAAFGQRSVVRLNNGRGDKTQYFERVERNGGELLQLDAGSVELPANVPHTLTRITGERQAQISVLDEADDGRVLELRPGEIFAVRLSAGRPPGFAWGLDGPAAGILLEMLGDGTVVPSEIQFAAASLPPVPDPPPAPKPRPGAKPVRPAAIPPKPVRQDYFDVWQLIAPAPGVSTLRFLYRHVAGGKADPPVKVFTLNLVVR